jgi:hypothetical protein
VIFALLLSCKSVKYSELIKKADEKFYVRNYKSAYHLYSKASKMEVKEIYSKIKKAESFYLGHPIKSKNLSKSIDLYNDCFRSKNNSKEALLSRAQFFYYYDRYINAIEDLDTLESKHGAFYPAKMLRAEIFYTIRDNENAEKEINKAIIIAPNKSEAYLIKGKFEYNMGMWEQAKNDLLSSYKFCNNKLKFNGAYELILAYDKIGNRDSACYYYQAYKHYLKEISSVSNKCN